MHKFVIHIGYSKTGTTTLQSHLFPKHDEIIYLGKYYNRSEMFFDKYIAEAMRLIVSQDSLDYSHKRCEDLINKSTIFTSNNQNRPFVVSNEQFMHIFTPGAADRTLIAERIMKIFKECKIIIVIRNQIDFIKSMYIHSCYKPAHYMRFKNYLNDQYNHFNTKTWHYIDYYKTIKCYEKYFGIENVGVFLFEDLIQNSTHYFSKICEFIGVNTQKGIEISSSRPHENPRKTSYHFLYAKIACVLWPMIPIEKMLNGQLRSWKNSILNRGKPVKLQLGKQWSDTISRLFSYGNKRLMDERGFSLDKYSYPLND